MENIVTNEQLTALAQLLANTQLERDKAMRLHKVATEHSAELYTELEKSRKHSEEAFEKYYKAQQDLTAAQSELEEARDEMKSLKKGYKVMWKANKEQRERIEALERALAAERGADA